MMPHAFEIRLKLPGPIAAAMGASAGCFRVRVVVTGCHRSAERDVAPYRRGALRVDLRPISYPFRPVWAVVVSGTGENPTRYHVLCFQQFASDFEPVSDNGRIDRFLRSGIG